MTLRIKRERADERHLVLRSVPRRAAGEFAAEIGIVDLDGATQSVVGLAFDHRLHQLVVDQPSGGVAHPQITLQGQRRESGLGLADQVDRQKPDRQRQLGALKHRANDQRGLVVAGIALEGLAPPGDAGPDLAENSC